MKKYINISMFIFWAVTVTVATAGLIVYNGDKSGQAVTSSNADDTSQIGGITNGSITGVNSGTVDLVLSTAELAKHNSASSCWLLISGKIYDVTTYIKQHPGGANEILPTCGTDATAAYASRGGTGTHSSSANADLANYYIGDLNQTITTSSTNTTSSVNSPQTTPAIANPSFIPPSSRGDGDEDDDD